MSFTNFRYTPKQLLRQMAQAKGHHLPPYYQEALQEMRQAAKSLGAQLIATNRDQDSTVTQDSKLLKLPVLIAQIARVKRYMLVYLKLRLDRLEAHYWKNGNEVLREEKENLGAAEAKYFADYKQLVGQYSDSVGLDLGTGIMPPLSIHTEVRVLENCGELLLQSGDTVLLTKGSVQRLRRKDIEHLILQGYLLEL